MGAAIVPSSSPSSHHFLAHNAVLGVATTIAGLLGFTFQAILTHRLSPAQFAAAFTLISLISLLAVPAGALTLLMAREAAQAEASGRPQASSTLLRTGNRALLLLGLLIGILLALVSSGLGQFFHTPSVWVIAAFVGTPFLLATPLALGELQGEQRFGALGTVYLVQAGLKLVLAIGLGQVLGGIGVLWGLSLASALTYALTIALIRKRLVGQADHPNWAGAFRYLSVIVPSTLLVGILLSTDLVLVKHLFSGQVAGEYAAVAALGRAIFWGAASIAAVLFPKVVLRESTGARAVGLVFASLFLVGGGGLLVVAIFSLFGSRLLVAFAGTAYIHGASYVGLYALAMTLMALSMVLVTTYQSRGKPGFLAILAAVGVIEVALILMFHGSARQVVIALDLSMLILFAALAALYAPVQARPGLRQFSHGLRRPS